MGFGIGEPQLFHPLRTFRRGCAPIRNALFSLRAHYFSNFAANLVRRDKGSRRAQPKGGRVAPRFGGPAHCMAGSYWRVGCAAFAYCSARAMTRATVAGCQAPPRADLMPRALSAAAMPASDATPDDRTLSMIGMTLSAWAVACVLSERLRHRCVLLLGSRCGLFVETEGRHPGKGGRPGWRKSCPRHFYQSLPLRS
jgi:hypothetical protein